MEFLSALCDCTELNCGLYIMSQAAVRFYGGWYDVCVCVCTRHDEKDWMS